jgi:DNA-binding transcriptional LysR family regulator
MDQLSEMRVFVRAIERGTFAAAAGDLGLTPSAVSKLITRLEARLRVRLVNRTTRKLSLTAEGETYFHSGRRLIDAIDSLEHEVSASARHPRGLLRINTALSFGVQHLSNSASAFPTCVSASPSPIAPSIFMPNGSMWPCASDRRVIQT